MKITVYNKLTIQNMDLPEVPHLIISISTPKEPQAILRLNENSRVLRLSFHDIDTIVMGYNDYLEPEMFQPRDAEKILEALKIFPSPEEIIVHCDAGLSRSPGVAAAIAKILNGDDTEFYKRHSGLNRRVYRMILDQHYGPMMEETNDGNGDH